MPSPIARRRAPSPTTISSTSQTVLTGVSESSQSEYPGTHLVSHVISDVLSTPTPALTLERLEDFPGSDLVAHAQRLQARVNALKKALHQSEAL